VHHEQGQGQIAFTVTATRDQIAAGSEWAVIVTGNRRGTVGQGTITVDAPEPPAPEAGALDTWLRAHPAVAFHLTWNDGERSRSYSAWPAEMREALGSAVEAARAGRFSLADDPPANAWKRASDDPDAVHTAFAPEVARALYIATVAHSLAVEIDRRVPWSLDDLNGDELETLLASSSLFGWNPEQRGYEISEFDHGWATPAQPATSWAFLQQQRLLASSRLDTIVALVGWSRNLTHSPARSRARTSASTGATTATCRWRGRSPGRATPAPCSHRYPATTQSGTIRRGARGQPVSLRRCCAPRTSLSGCDRSATTARRTRRFSS